MILKPWSGPINIVTDSHAEASKGQVLIEGGRFDSRKGLVQGQGTVGPLSANLSFSHSSNAEQLEKNDFAQHAVNWNIGLDPDAHWDLRLTEQYTKTTARSFPEGRGGPDCAILRETDKPETQTFLTGLTAALESHHR